MDDLRSTLDRFFAGTLNDAAQTVVKHALSGQGGYACFVNVHVAVTASRRLDVGAALDQAELAFPDGWPVAWLQRRLGAANARRIAGPDLMPAVLEFGSRKGLRHVLYGSTPQVIERLRSNIEARFPGAEVVGAVSPPFGLAIDEHRPYVARALSLEPNVVWCALGAPQQELWMRYFRDEAAPALLMGVGAAFDFLAGTKPRAPRSAQLLGLEWAHRLVSEPRRLARRYATTNLLFVYLATRALLDEYASSGSR